MKSRKILLLLILSVFLFTLAACAGEVGPQGPAGPAGSQGQTGQTGQPGAPGKDGVDGKDGKDGQDGKDGDKGQTGKGAYDIYKEAYPGYDGTEAEWLEDLQNNKLFVTVKIAYKDNSGYKYISFSKGDKVPTDAVWFFDKAFEEAVPKNTVLLENLTVYVKDKYVGTPIEIPVLYAELVRPVAVDYDKDNNPINIYYLVDAYGQEYQLDPLAQLKDQDNAIITSIDNEWNAGLAGKNNVKLSGFDFVALLDVQFVDGLVVSARIASGVTAVSTTPNTWGKIVVPQTTSSPDKLQVHDYMTVQEVLDVLVSTHAQTRRIVEKVGNAYIPIDPTSMVNDDLYLEVYAESGKLQRYQLDPANRIGKYYSDDRDGTVTEIEFDDETYHVAHQTLRAERGSSITLLHGATVQYLLDNIGQLTYTKVTGLVTTYPVKNPLFVPTFVVTNSQGTEKAATDLLAEGDQVVVTAKYFPTVNYYVQVNKNNVKVVDAKKNAASQITAAFVTGVVSTSGSEAITVKYGAKVSDLFTDLNSTTYQVKIKGTELVGDVGQTYKLFKKDGTKNVAYTANDLLTDAFKLEVTAQNTTDKTTYSFARQNHSGGTLVSVSNAIAEFKSDLRLEVVKNITANGLIQYLKYAYTPAGYTSTEATFSLTGKIAVLDSEGTPKVGLDGVLYTGDQIVVTSPLGTEAAEDKVVYTIYVTKAHPGIQLAAKSNLNISLNTTAKTILLNQQFVDGANYPNVDPEKVKEEFRLGIYGHNVSFHAIDNEGKIIAGSTINSFDDYSKDYYMRFMPFGYDNENHVDYKISFRALSTSTTLSIPAATKNYIENLSGTTLTVNFSKLPAGTVVAEVVESTNILNEIDFTANFQKDAKIFKREVSGETTTDTEVNNAPLENGKTYVLKYKTQAGVEQTVTISLKYNSTLDLVPVKDQKLFTATTSTITVEPETSRAVGTKISDLIAAINEKYHNQEVKISKKVGTAEKVIENNTSIVLTKDMKEDVSGTQTAVTYFVDVKAEGGQTRSYTISVKDKSDNRTVNLVQDAKGVRIDATNSEVIVAFGSTKYTLLGNGVDIDPKIDVDLFYQAIVILKNDGSAKGDTALVDYDILRVTAQDGKVKDYVIKVAAENKQASLLAERTDLSGATNTHLLSLIEVDTGVIYVDYASIHGLEITKSVLLGLVKDGNAKSIEVIASDGKAIADDEVLLPGTIVRVTLKHGEFANAKVVDYRIQDILLKPAP